MKIIHKIIMASAMFGCAYAQNIVSVEAFDEQGNNPSQLTLRLKLTNNTSSTLNDVHAKYFLGVSSCFHAAIITTSFRP